MKWDITPKTNVNEKSNGQFEFLANNTSSPIKYTISCTSDTGCIATKEFTLPNCTLEDEAVIRAEYSCGNKITVRLISFTKKNDSCNTNGGAVRLKLYNENGSKCSSGSIFLIGPPLVTNKTTEIDITDCGYSVNYGTLYVSGASYGSGCVFKTNVETVELKACPSAVQVNVYGEITGMTNHSSDEYTVRGFIRISASEAIDCDITFTPLDANSGNFTFAKDTGGDGVSALSITLNAGGTLNQIDFTHENKGVPNNSIVITNYNATPNSCNGRAIRYVYTTKQS